VNRLLLPLLFVIPVYAHAQQPSPDALDEALAICLSHVHQPVMAGVPRYDPQWQHCSAIEGAVGDRDWQARESEESANPDLKKTRDLVKALGAKK
jgi:hypothetical protein